MKTVKDVEINLNQGKVVKNAQDLCSLRRNIRNLFFSELF